MLVVCIFCHVCSRIGLFRRARSGMSSQVQGTLLTRHQTLSFSWLLLREGRKRKHRLSYMSINWKQNSTHTVRTVTDASSKYMHIIFLLFPQSKYWLLPGNQSTTSLPSSTERVHASTCPSMPSSPRAKWIISVSACIVCHIGTKQVRAMWTLSVSVCIGAQKVRGSVDHLSKCIHCLSHWYTSMGNAEHLSKCIHGLLFVCVGISAHMVCYLYALAHKTVRAKWTISVSP